MPILYRRTIALCMLIFAILACCPACRAQAALLMEEPYGFFGALNPTGHTAVYFARICAETPVKLRRCRADEDGSVIARYQGIAGYDWVAMPLVPYLYSVEDIAEAPQHVDRATVLRLRNRYHESHMGMLGADVFAGNIVRGGWTQLVGVAYERRIYAFRFNTTEEQDDALIEKLNSHPNASRFNLLYTNCADFARDVMNTYFPRTFRRTIFPDAGITTPRQITFKLVRYAKKHPDLELSVFEIPQVRGYRRMSHVNKSISASLVTTGYAVPLTILNPYVAGAVFMDYLVRGRYPLIPAHLEVLKPATLADLATPQDQPEPAINGEQPAPQSIPAERFVKSSLTRPAGEHE
ncbi:MAG: hypothetical protein ACLGSD_01720 [Acidobacteriota bacterium]